MCADVARVECAVREERSVRVERQLRVDHEIAGMAVADHRLATIPRPLHRSTHALGRPRNQRILRIAGIPGAVAAADFARDDADGFRGHAEDHGDIATNPPRPTGSRVDRVAPSGRVEVADGGAWLHRHAGHAVDAAVERDDVRGARERGVRRGGIAGLRLDGDIRRARIPHGDCAGRDRVRRRDDRGQRAPLHGHSLGTVARGERRLGDDHRDGLAGEAGAIDGQGQRLRDEERRAVGALERHFVWIRRHRPMRDRLEPVRDEIRARQHGEHTGARQRRCRIDAHDARMCVRRADHRRIRLTRKVDVVRVAPGAGDEARIFPTTYRLADAVWRRSRARSEKRHGRYSISNRAACQGMGSWACSKPG